VWDIGVHSVHSLVLVVVHVVWFERLAGREARGEVGHDGGQPVRRILVRAGPTQVVTQLVHGQLQRVVHRAADHVGAGQENEPLGVAHQPRHQQLQQQDAQADPERQRLGSE
jgi:hypothetical protein